MKEQFVHWDSVHGFAIISACSKMGEQTWTNYQKDKETRDYQMDRKVSLLSLEGWPLQL